MGIFIEKSIPVSQEYVDNSITTVSGNINNTIQSQSIIDLADAPDTYEDGLYLMSTVSGVVFAGPEFARYYIEAGDRILVNDYGQYIIHETKYIEVGGTLELGNGSMLILI